MRAGEDREADLPSLLPHTRLVGLWQHQEDVVGGGEIQVAGVNLFPGEAGALGAEGQWGVWVSAQDPSRVLMGLVMERRPEAE